jgi:undecaprenyl-phosphate 4-deoxy-4-formamido-L-arabinose transferase
MRDASSSPPLESEPLDVSVVVPVYGGAKTIEPLSHAVLDVADRLGWRCEILLVCDAPRDNSWAVASALARQSERVTAIRLMRNFGQHPATLLGIRQARGRTIVTMDEDLQHNPEDIPQLVETSEREGAIVYGMAEELQHAWWRNLTSRLAKWFIARYFAMGDAQRISAFRAFPSAARDAFASYRGERVAVDVLLSWSGLPLHPVRCAYAARAEGESGYTFRKLLRYLSDLLLGYTTAPLRLASYTGLLSVLVAIGIGVYAIVNWWLHGSVVPGFAFLALSTAAFAGVQLLALGVMGEYLGRLYFNSLGKPQYLVAEVASRGDDATETTLDAEPGGR